MMLASFWDFFTEDLFVDTAKILYQIVKAAIGFFG